MICTNSTYQVIDAPLGHEPSSDLLNPLNYGMPRHSQFTDMPSTFFLPSIRWITDNLDISPIMNQGPEPLPCQPLHKLLQGVNFH